MMSRVSKEIKKVKGYGKWKWNTKYLYDNVRIYAANKWPTVLKRIDRK